MNIKNKYIEKLENLVGRRFDYIADLEKHLTSLLQAREPIKLYFATQNYESDHTVDWNLVGSFVNDEIFCDFDIYFLYDRYNNLHITEVGYEF